MARLRLAASSEPRASTAVIPWALSLKTAIKDCHTDKALNSLESSWAREGAPQLRTRTTLYDCHITK